MDTRPQPPEEDDALDALLGRARQFILDLITLIEARLFQLGDAPMSARLARLLTRRALLPAEAALRRAILLIAATLPAPETRPVPRKAPPRSSSPSPERAAPARAPVFRMSEPQPRDTIRPRNDYLPEHLLPRITLLTDAALAARAPAPSLAAPTRDPAASFHKRLRALCLAFENPVREARRWRRRQLNQPPGAKPPLAARIPGTRKSLGETALNLLRDLTIAAEATLLPNTS